ncbi:MAG: hypothetical protein GXY51_02375 [Bacteroidetes bacterium]|jgi:hypothetical protein|nr:hypothetical protein [Bacteroidota bacterium]
MKKLGKLKISPKKIMNNEELLTLRGGAACCTCCDGYAMAAISYEDCQESCSYAGGGVWIC